ncbi:hypothetical protein [Legionella pneumophila]
MSNKYKSTFVFSQLFIKKTGSPYKNLHDREMKRGFIYKDKLHLLTHVQRQGLCFYFPKN